MGTVKSRIKPKELLILEQLHKRLKLPNQFKQYYFSLKKGYEGEIIFDSLTEKLQCECLILNDLLLEVNNTTFQIDSLIIAQGNVLFYEIKNYDGDYYYEKDKLYKKPKFEIINPLDQLSRSSSLLRQLLLSLGYNLPIESFVVFINPNFTMYQAPIEKPIIFPTQLNHYLGNLDSSNSKLTVKHKKLAEQLVKLHKTNSSYSHLPSYDYEQLRKGIICNNCHSFSVSVNKRHCVCTDCGQAEPVAKAVLRTVSEFKLLFPDRKITTNIIHDWCKVIRRKERIRKILKTRYKIVGVRQWAYYE